jgi:DNA-directed RNA polymerase subunit M/transcription elongation factor TFIIS
MIASGYIYAMLAKHIASLNDPQRYRAHGCSVLFNELNVWPVFRNSRRQAAIVAGYERGVYNQAIDLAILSNNSPSWVLRWFRSTYISTIAEAAGEIMESGVFVSKLVEGAINPYDAASMNVYERHPEHFVLVKKDDEDRRKGTIEEKFTDVYKCPKCGGRKTKGPVCIQIRQADEPAHEFIKCYICTHVF